MDAKPASSPVLQVLTFEYDATPEPPCTGGYTCLCARCDRERDRRKRQGVRRAVAQPWHVKRAT